MTADGERVSSSWIRELVRQGEVEHAARLLGRAPWLDGTVVRGFARGRALGVPTANLRWTPGRVVPAPGIYAGFGVLGPGEERYPAAISVGGNPTFSDVEGTVVEAYLIGFEGDAYDRPMRVEFRRFLRHELAFETVEELVEQMWRDIEAARALAEASGAGLRAAGAELTADLLIDVSQSGDAHSHGVNGYHALRREPPPRAPRGGRSRRRGGPCYSPSA